jgi:hypothetical protein
MFVLDVFTIVIATALSFCLSNADLLFISLTALLYGHTYFDGTK